MKKQKSVPNRKTIRTKKYKAGEFTAVPNKLLHDPNLSLKAKMLLIQMLSDSDDFTVSASLYAKRMNVSTSTIYNGFDELEEKGHLKRTPITKAVKGLKREGSSKKVYHYTISEFGNLNKETKSSENETKQAQKAEEMPEEIIKKLDDYLASLGDYWNDDRVQAKTSELAIGITNDEELSSFVKQIDDLVVILKKEILSRIENEIMVKGKDTISQSKYKAFKDQIKKDLFDSNRIPDWEKLRTRWLHYRNRNKPKKQVDFETAQFDKLEQEWDDMH